MSFQVSDRACFVCAADNASGEDCSDPAQLALWSFIAHAERRVVLLIGNGAYTKVPSLENPKNDVAAMEMMFKAAGFRYGGARQLSGRDCYAARAARFLRYSP